MFDALSERRLAAIILGDVVGYSRLMGIDEVGTMTALKAHRNELIVPALAAYRGRMVGTTGDAMLMEFGSAVDAVSCAAIIQRKVMARNTDIPEERRLRFRLGINLGDIVIDGEEIYGDGVNVAARLETLCEPGGLCLSRSIEEQVRGKLSFPFEDGGEQQLKNISHPIRIFRVAADFIATLPETALPASRRKTPAPVARIAPGTVLNDTYKIDELVGSGGMGEIFKGHEIHSGGLVAIKVMRLEMMNNETALALFQKEARVLKDIHHDAIVRYYIFSFDPTSQRHYLTMEFVDGTALSTLVKQGPLGFGAVSALCKRVASGLQVAHESGIIHRDVSPDNIIVPQGDVSRAKIIDFGIARAADIGGGTIIGGGFAGKYNYVSPEQLGLAGSEVTAQSDIYSFGLVLAEACLGTALDMGGTQADVIEKRRTVPDLGGIDPRIRPLIERMLQPDPANRPASMAEVAGWSNQVALRTISLALDGGAIEPPRVPKPKAKAPPKSGRPVERWITGGTLGAVLVLGGGLFAYQTWIAPTPVRKHADGPVLPPAPPEPQPTPPQPQPTPPEPQPTPPQPTPPEPTPPEPEPTAPEPRPSLPPAVDRITDYIRTYKGSGCFFAQPLRVTATSAAIDGFAQSKDDLAGLDQAFTQAMGFAPDIVGIRVSPPQCTALDFMRHVKTDGTAPTLFLKSGRIGRDQLLSGEVHGQGQRSLALLQVREDGTVVNVSKGLKSDGTAQTFDLNVARGAGTGAATQVLIVVASAHPIAVLSKNGEMSAAQIFRSMLDEAAGKGESLSATAKAFLIGG